MFVRINIVYFYVWAFHYIVQILLVIFNEYLNEPYSTKTSFQHFQSGKTEISLPVSKIQKKHELLI